MVRPRKNNADYFSHDAGMRKDGRIMVLRSKYGHDGYAAYCMTLELLAEADGFEMIIDEVEIEIVAADFGFSPEKLLEIWKESDKLRLLEFSDRKLICSKLIKRLQPLLKERQRQRDKANKRWEKEGVSVPGDDLTMVKPGENPGETMQSKGKNSKRKKKAFVPPSWNEFEKYWIDNGYASNMAEKAFKGYEVADWHDSKGSKIKNWKQKCQHVWFKPENRSTYKNISEPASGLTR